MRGRRRELLVLIEQRPRTVRELRALTDMTLSAVYDALREYKALGVVVGSPTRISGVGRAAQKVYGLPGVDLAAAA